MEACGTAHHWGRQALARGHEVRLLPAQYVRPYVRRNKTDRADSEALLEAARCADIRPVLVKSVEQQACRPCSVSEPSGRRRVARINGIRSLLAEHGHAMVRGARTILRRVTTLLDDSATGLSEPLRVTLMAAVEEVHALEEKIATVDRQLRQVADAHPVAARLQTIPGVGVLTATAMVAALSRTCCRSRRPHRRPGGGETAQPSKFDRGNRRPHVLLAGVVQCLRRRRIHRNRRVCSRRVAGRSS